MKHLTLTLALVLLTSSSFAQTTFDFCSCELYSWSNTSYTTILVAQSFSPQGEVSSSAVLHRQNFRTFDLSVNDAIQRCDLDHAKAIAKKICPAP